MKKIIIILLSVITTPSLLAQTPYTQPQFDYDSTFNIIYGTATNYAGGIDTLYLDIYKPVGDANCLRPIMLFAHGGAWVVDSKENESMQYMSREMAKRGWVVANIDYRLGTNKATDYSANSFCSSISEPCAYICDSMEISRANFRAMQDAKGAIRFLKSRNLIDSTDIDNVFMAGESAGGFISLSTGFTKTVDKKPVACFAIGVAPTPDSDLAALSCFVAGNDLTRPDLGSIEGNLHLGAFNADLKGVGSFFGGAFNLSIFENTTNPPVVYLFCQGADVVVHYEYGPIFERIGAECYSGICPPYQDYPNAYGGKGINNYFTSIGLNSPVFQAEIVENYAANNNCTANGHAIDDPAIRLQNMVDFFAIEIANSTNSPISNCAAVGDNAIDNKIRILLLPNPVKNRLKVNVPRSVIGSNYILSNKSGVKIMSGTIRNTNSFINTENLPKGLYLFTIASSVNMTIKFIKD